MAGRNTSDSSRSSHMSATQDQLTEMIRKKAYELYMKRGKRPGHDLDNWLEAERIIRQKAF